MTPKNSVAVAFLYNNNQGGPIKASVNLTEVGLLNPRGYNFTEVFDNQPLGMFKAGTVFSCFVNPSGVFIAKATAL